MLLRCFFEECPVTQSAMKEAELIDKTKECPTLADPISREHRSFISGPPSTFLPVNRSAWTSHPPIQPEFPYSFIQFNSFNSSFNSIKLSFQHSSDIKSTTMNCSCGINEFQNSDETDLLNKHKKPSKKIHRCRYSSLSLSSSSSSSSRGKRLNTARTMKTTVIK